MSDDRREFSCCGMRVPSDQRARAARLSKRVELGVHGTLAWEWPSSLSPRGSRFRHDYPAEGAIGRAKSCVGSRCGRRADAGGGRAHRGGGGDASGVKVRLSRGGRSSLREFVVTGKGAGKEAGWVGVRARMAGGRLSP